MGTSNFHTVNAYRTYVIKDRYYNEEDQHSIYIDWREIKESVVCYGEQIGWDASNKAFGFGRDLDNAVISKDYWFEYSNSGYRYRIEAFITINAGYYEHCNLDYRFVFDGMSEDDNVDDILDMMCEDFVESNNCIPLSYGNSDNKYWNDGLRKMQAKNFRKAAEWFLDNMVDECEVICKSLCDEQWMSVCRASNGETLYEKVG